MQFLFVFVMGAFRVAQSVLNKNVSVYTPTVAHKLKFGVLFESAAALFSLAYLFVSGVSGIHYATLICALLTGLGFLGELLTSLALLSRAPLVLCTLCSLGGGIVLPAVVGIFCFGEPLSALQWIGIVLFFLAAWLLTPKSTAEKTVAIGKALPFAVANFLINGALTIIGKFYAVYAESTNPSMFSCWSYAFAAILFGLVLLWKKRDTGAATPVFEKKIYIFGGALGAVCASIVCFSVILNKFVPLVILNTVPNAICITGSLFIGALFFKEKIQPKHLAGTVLSITSVVLILCASSLTGGIL